MKFYLFNNGLVVEKGESGSDKRVFEWGKIFKKRDYQVKVFIPEVGLKKYRKEGFDCIVTSRIKMKRFGHFLTYIWQGFRACLAQSRIEKDAIIYSSSDLLADVLPAIYMKIRNREARWITGLHLIAPNPFKGFGSHLTFPRLSNLYLFLSQRFFMFFMKRLATLILISNKGDREFLIKRGFPKDKILVTYGGVNPVEIGEGTEEKRYDASFIGRLHPQKGIPDLFQAWSEVVKRMPEATLAIVAEPDLEEYFEKRISMKELNKNVKFLGFLNGKEKYRVLKSSKLLIFPSTYESFGLVACEAMACGLPVVAYDLPLYREIYPRGMVKSPMGDVKGLAQNILRLLKNEKERAWLSQEAKETVRNYSWDRTADSILKALSLT